MRLHRDIFNYARIRQLVEIDIDFLYYFIDILLLLYSLIKKCLFPICTTYTVIQYIFFFRKKKYISILYKNLFWQDNKY